MPKTKVDLSIVMPCLNEARTLKKCICDAQSFLVQQKISGEIIVVDNGSTDGSAGIAKKYDARVVVEKRKGYGRALRTGFEAARGKYIIMGDCDRTYDFSNMTKLWQTMQESDLVVGNRFAGKREEGALSPLHCFGARTLSWLARKRYKNDIYDYHCGLRGFRRSILKKLHLRTTGMELATEMIAKASRKGFMIKQIPISYHKSVKGRKSKLRAFRDGFRHLDYILLGQMKPLWRKIWRLSFVFITSVLLGLFALLAVAHIPSSAIKQNVSESADFYQRQSNLKPNLVKNYNGSKMDLYADSVWLSIAYGYEPNLHSVIESKYAYKEDANQDKNLRAQIDGELTANRPYFRYWHGSLVLIRPLLTIFNAPQLYLLGEIAVIALLITIVVMLCRHEEFGGAAIFITASLMGGIIFGGISFEYMQAFLVMGLISIAAMRLVWSSKRKLLPYLLFFSGILVNYLDFLTAETVTLTIPLLLVLWLDRKKIMTERKFEKVLGLILLWVLGYALMWAAKWFISWLALGNEVWSDVGNQMGVRSFRGEAGLSTLELMSYSFRRNIENLFPLCLGSVFKTATAIVAVVFAVFAIKNHKSKISWFWIVSVIVVGLLPILRIALLTEHGARHYFFTYRALSATIMAFIMIFAGIIKRKTGSDNL